jgi:hypothetical protein
MRGCEDGEKRLNLGASYILKWFNPFLPQAHCSYNEVLIACSAFSAAIFLQRSNDSSQLTFNARTQKKI